MYIVIPARRESSRMPLKLLQSINNKSILQHTYERCVEAMEESRGGITDVIVAVDCDELFAHTKTFPNIPRIINTGRTHPDREFANGTERCWAVSEYLQMHTHETIINVQGDSFDISYKVILELVKAIVLNTHGSNKARQAYTLCENLHPSEQDISANVKVIRDSIGRVVFFTRMPYYALTTRKHIGIYGYHVAFLNQYTRFGRGVLETAESLEQMRCLENRLALFCPELPEGMNGGTPINTAFDLEQAKLTYEY